MTVPTSASATLTIDATPELLYDLISDVTRMGEWSPECTSCEWIDTPGEPGSRFQGHNRRGPARWTTTAKVLRAERGVEFTFATLHGDEIPTRWTYKLDGQGPTVITESFEAVHTPLLFAVLERTVLRRRQAQLEAGLHTTLEQLKRFAEAATVARGDEPR
jgi:uncharacterized protein YndB with AHSA1/START domain